ncbi:hypothetical protein [Streptomyces sp. MUM 178J]|uniref:hypothetical protein n=1 Tax=Streptomyces sp. MUM 178J TaxID=2791991 RepID=UPI001F037833|nr:hypothetical protein [Streptomyces sp. MUM 178J]WRQ78038.1 hypothetical protein I3F59_000795 [Streptomyces sp. MUM 178J]
MRRALLAAAALTLAGQALSTTAAPAALAHGGTLDVEITGHSFGHVRTTVTWENDSDPVAGRVAATVNAVSADGTQNIGPWKLIPAQDAATGYTTAEALPPGRWTVTVEAGHPGLGRDQAELTVSPGTPASPAAPQSSPPPEAAPPAASAAPPAAGPDEPATATAAAAPDAAADAGTGPAAYLAAAGAVLACAAGLAVAWRIRRARAHT